MKIITSITAFNDAVGMRLSATYSEIDDNTGRVISDNKRFDRVVTDQGIIADINSIMEYAKESITD